MPHAPRVVPPWQTPFMSQQPAAQFCGLQLLAEPPAVAPPPVAIPPLAPPPVPPSRRKKLPPPVPLPPSMIGVWQVPALQTWPVRQSTLDMQRVGCLPPHAPAKERMKKALHAATTWG